MLFSSEATNLVSGDTARCGVRSCSDIFVFDRDADADGIFDEAGATSTTMVSRASNGESANGDCYEPSISDDGRYVALTSYAANLVAPDGLSDLDVFVHDRDTGRTGALRDHGALDPEHLALCSPYMRRVIGEGLLAREDPARDPVRSVPASERMYAAPLPACSRTSLSLAGRCVSLQ